MYVLNFSYAATQTVCWNPGNSQYQKIANYVKTKLYIHEHHLLAYSY